MYSIFILTYQHNTLLFHHAAKAREELSIRSTTFSVSIASATITILREVPTGRARQLEPCHLSTLGHIVYTLV